MRKIFVLPVVLMMAASCRTVTFNDLHSSNSNVNKLPALNVKVDKDSLKTAYPVRKISSGSGTESGSLNFYGTVSSYEQDSRARDIVSLINYDVRNNIAASTGKISGEFKVRLSNVDNGYNASYYLLTVLQTLTLYIPSIFGAPIGEQVCDIELEVEIMNNHKEIVAYYTETGRGTAKIAAYYGFNSREGARYCAIQAVQSAMDKVKLNIAENYQRLNNDLRK